MIVPVGIVICLIGLIGNTISVYVWRRIMISQRSGSTATTIYFITLGLVDIGLLLFLLLTDTIPNHALNVVQTFPHAAFFAFFGLPMFSFLIIARTLLLVGVTMTRFTMVKFPFKTTDWCSKKSINIDIGSILAVAFILNLPCFFIYYLVENKGQYQLKTTRFGSSKLAQKYQHWVNSMFVVLVPCTIIMVLNFCIIFLADNPYVDKSKIEDKQATLIDPNMQKPTDSNLTLVLLTVTFTFILLLGLQSSAQSVFGMLWEEQQVLNVMVTIIISSINFFLYCFTGSTFRNELKKMSSSVRAIYLPHVSLPIHKGPL